MPGRKAIPAHLKLIAGNPGKRPIRLPADYVITPGGEESRPEKPSHLDEHAGAEWDRIVPELLKLGMVRKVDRAMLGMYCTAYGRWQTAEQEILKLRERQRKDGEDGQGLISISRNGFEQMSYWLVISNKAQDQLRSYALEFGMSASSAERFRSSRASKAAAAATEEDPMEGVLRASKHVANG